MKKCPKCGAEIDDNARFCMYCMTSLDNKVAVESSASKKKLGVIIMAALLGILLIAIVLFFAFCGKGDNNDSESSPALIIGSQNDYGSSENPDSNIPALSSKVDKDNTTTSNTSSNNPSSDKTSSLTATSKPQGSSSVSSKPESSSEKAPIASNKPTAPSSSNPSSPVSSANSSSTPDSSTIYTYRAAQSSDDELVAGSTLMNGGITITGVAKAPADGVYVIPEFIDGKKVVAVDKYAFNSEEIKDTVKVVVFPKSMLSVNVYSFYYCYNITDIYFAGEKTYIAGDAFPKPEKRNYIITLHSSGTAENRNFTKLKNFAIMYHEMLFEAWDGGAIN